MTLMMRICAWCGKIMGSVTISDGKKNKMTTHGICAECTKQNEK